jgi:hypothetical protein
LPEAEVVGLDRWLSQGLQHLAEEEEEVREELLQLCKRPCLQLQKMDLSDRVALVGWLLLQLAMEPLGQMGLLHILALGLFLMEQLAETQARLGLAGLAVLLGHELHILAVLEQWGVQLVTVQPQQQVLSGALGVVGVVEQLA